MTPGTRRDPLTWVLAASAALAVVAGAVVAVQSTDDDRARSAPVTSPAPTTEPDPDPDPTIDPTIDSTNGYWPELAFDPDRRTTTFAIDDGMSATVDGILIEQVYAAPVDMVGYIVSGDGISSIAFFGPVGTVIEIPGWGLLSLMEVESSGEGRPELVMHFEAQVDPPLEAAPVEP